MPSIIWQFARTVNCARFCNVLLRSICYFGQTSHAEKASAMYH